MATVLFVKANDRPVEQATSVKLYYSFLEQYKKSNPDDTIIELDLYKQELPYLNADMINGIFKSARGMELTAEESTAVGFANRYLDQFLAADKVVFAFPLWNMTVPAVLHTYFDYLYQAGRTFSYTAQGPVGLVKGKKVVLLNARGGVYSEGPAAASEMAVNYASRMLRFFGIEDITNVIVEGHNQFPDQAQQRVQSGVDQAASVAAVF